MLLPLLVGVTTPAFAADDLADCAGIHNATERLACYDRLAARRATAPAGKSMEEQVGRSDQSQAEVSRGEVPQAQAAPLPTPAQTPAEVSTPVSRSDGTGIDRGGREGEDALAVFGKETRLKPVVELDHIDARIEAVRKSAGGQYVMTLSNGQVWMENEPGRRPIEPGQDVTITRHRFYFEMALKSRPNVAVHRVQ